MFEIYGPDGGELELVRREIEKRNLSDVVHYQGALQADEVQKLLREIDLLVLPSRDDNFPMVILEALAVGTPVLVMPSCGFAETLKTFDPNFVAASEDLSGLLKSFEKQFASNYCNKTQQEIMDFCTQVFGISSVTDKSFKLEGVPPIWEKRFGPSVLKRAVFSFLGGIVAMVGARLADGCPSGHGLSGLMQLSVSGFVALAMFFGIGAIVANFIFRKA